MNLFVTTGFMLSIIPYDWQKVSVSSAHLGILLIKLNALKETFNKEKVHFYICKKTIFNFIIQHI